VQVSTTNIRTSAWLQGKRMHLATMWLGICGLALMAMLMLRRVKGAIMVGE
jgi:xanthine/uracil/vitamin C permease (AzgA family)